jgi:hypothetical protein
MGRGLVRRLKEEGVGVIHHDEKFAQGTPDSDWLPVVGAERWILLTKDDRIRYRPNEREALLNSGVRAFVFTGGNMSGVEMADTIIAALPKIRRLLAKNTAAFVARITSVGDVAIVVTSDDR